MKCSIEIVTRRLFRMNAFLLIINNILKIIR